MLEALILASTNPQYDNRLFIDIQNNLCTQHVLSLQFSCTELVNQLTIDARISASEKDLPVTKVLKIKSYQKCSPKIRSAY